MLFYGDSSNKLLSEKIGSILGSKIHYPEVVIFPDGERRVRILEEVSNHDVLLLKSFGQPVDSQIPEFCFTIDCLKRNGANLVTAIVPYLPYSRADHMFRIGEGVALEVIIGMFESVHLDKILIVDPHSIKTPEVFNIPVICESAMELFAEKIHILGTLPCDLSIVSPDMGGIARIQKLGEIIKHKEGEEVFSVVTINKDRDIETGKLGISGMNGNMGQVCVIVDDIIASGKTIVQAADALWEKGCHEIYAFATHAVFAKESPDLLQKSKVKKIYVTDSLPVTADKMFKKLEVLSIGELVVKALK